MAGMLAGGVVGLGQGRSMTCGGCQVIVGSPSGCCVDMGVDLGSPVYPYRFPEVASAYRGGTPWGSTPGRCTSRG